VPLLECLRSPEKQEKITPVMQAITPGPRSKVEFMKKNKNKNKKTRLVQKQKGKAFFV